MFLFKRSGKSLWEACSGGKLASVKKLVSGRADINKVNSDYYGYSPLMIALREKHEDIVRFLLTCDGLDCNIVNNSGLTTLWLACDNNVSEDIVSTIVGRSLHINTRCGSSGYTPLHRTLYNKNNASSRVLLGRSNIDVNIVSNSGYSILYYACAYGAGEDIITTIEHKTSDDIVNKKYGRDNCTPIMAAVLYNNVGAVRVLGRITRIQWSKEELLSKASYTRYFSLRLNPTTGFNPIDGFTSNYWMQKHPLVGCSNICKAIADSRSHWEVAPYAQPIVQTTNK